MTECEAGRKARETNYQAAVAGNRPVPLAPKGRLIAECCGRMSDYGFIDDIFDGLFGERGWRMDFDPELDRVVIICSDCAEGWDYARTG